MKETAIKLIEYYQYFSKTMNGCNMLPLLFRSNCRYYPTCSDYTIEALRECGFWRGLSKGFVRILKCNPLTTIS